MKAESIFGDAATGSGAVAIAREWADRHLGGADLLGLDATSAVFAAPAGARIALERRISRELQSEARTRFGSRPALRMRRDLIGLAAVLAVLAMQLGSPDRAEAAVTASTTAAGGPLVVSSDAASDSIAITCVTGNVLVNGLNPNPPGTNVPCSSITSITVNGDGGNDTINLSGVSAAAGFNAGLDGLVTINGEGDLDSITGSEFADHINGGDGNDSASGGGGNDTINGGIGNDTLSGGTGNDTLDGDAGADVASGDAGDDVLTSNDGDALNGGDGNDTLNASGATGSSLNGGAGADLIDGSGASGVLTIVGASGADVIRGGSAGDNIAGNEDGDNIAGNGGADTISGGDGNDTIDGGADPDSIFGDFGDDILTGSGASDTLAGDCGNDTFKAAGGGVDTIRYGIGADDITDRDTAAPADVLQVEAAKNCSTATGESGTPVATPPTTTTPTTGGSGSGGSSTPGTTFGFSKAYMTNRAFSVGPEPTPQVIASAAQGTTIVYTLQRNTRVTMDIARRTSGHRGVSNRGSCSSVSVVTLRRSLGRRLSRRVRGKARERRLSRSIRARRCARARHIGSLQRTSDAGTNRVPFSGRIDSTPLKAGKYQLVLRGTEISTGATLPNVRLFFSIVRG